MDFLAIKRNLRKDYSSFKHFKLGLLSDAATQFLAIALRGVAFEHQIDLEIYEANIGSTWPEINGHGGLYRSPKPQGVCLCHSYPVIKNKFYKTEFDGRKNFADDFLIDFKKRLEILSENGISYVFSHLFSIQMDEVFGNLGFQIQNSFAFQLQKINLGLMELAAESQNLSLISYPPSYFDPKLYYTSQADISFEALPKVAHSIMQTLVAKMGVVKKCVVLDLDNTIWGGIVGDDGLENLELGQLGRGKVFVDLQLWLRELKNRGILLAVCSKNEEKTAKEVFLSHPEMVLKLDDLAVFVANWCPKSENIKFISGQLNIGIDSMVFLDDNEAEREQVKTSLLEILVPNLPNDPVEWLSFLQDLNLFETSSVSDEDFTRTQKYQQEANRKQASHAHQSLEEYLRNLEMKAKVLPIDSFTLPRVAQLLQRTNQFNLRTIRHSETEIKSMIDSGNYIGFALSLQDKFGDEGIVSAVLLNINEYLFIDSWVMSCRVFERGLEKMALNLMIEEGIKLQKNLKAEFLPTSKNQYLKNLLPSLGFEEKAGFFELKSEAKYFKEHFIFRNN